MQPRLDGRAWLGTARAYDNTFVVELFESKRHPGHYHYVTACAADGCCYETRQAGTGDRGRPVELLEAV